MPSVSCNRLPVVQRGDFGRPTGRWSLATLSAPLQCRSRMGLTIEIFEATKR